MRRGKGRQRIDGREKIGYNSKKSLPPFGAEGGEIAWVRKRPCLRQRKRRSLPPCTAAGGGCVKITELQLEGGKRMRAADAVNGRKIAVGDVFAKERA